MEQDTGPGGADTTHRKSGGCTHTSGSIRSVRVTKEHIWIFGSFLGRIRRISLSLHTARKIDFAPRN